MERMESASWERWTRWSRQTQIEDGGNRTNVSGEGVRKALREGLWQFTHTPKLKGEFFSWGDAESKIRFRSRGPRAPGRHQHLTLALSLRHNHTDEATEKEGEGNQDV